MDYVVPTHLPYSLTDMTQWTLSPRVLFTAVWLALVVLTMVSYGLGETGQTGSQTVYLLLGIAMIKSQLVAHYFMDLRNTTWLWRLVMLLYFLIVGGLIALGYLMGLT